MEVKQEQMDLAPASEKPKPKMGFVPWLAGGLGALSIFFFGAAFYHQNDIVIEETMPAVIAAPIDVIGDLVKETVPLNDVEPSGKTPLLPRYVENAAFISPLPKGAKKVVIVIDDVGVTDSSKNVLTLPREVTLSFLPYGKFTNQLARQARARGHEVMIHIPMEPKARLEEPTANPGPNALYVNDEIAEVKVNTFLNIKDLLNISVGANNHMGSRFTGHEAGMRAVMEIMEKERLFFMDSITTGTSMVTRAAKGLDVPVLKRDVFLDHYEGRENVDKALLQLEKTAERLGLAIAIGHPHQNTVDAINDWAKTLKDKGIYLVPVTAALDE